MLFRTKNITYDCEERRLAFSFFLQALCERKENLRLSSICILKYHSLAFSKELNSLYINKNKESDNSFKAINPFR